MRKIFRFAALLTLFATPFISAAQTGINVSYLQGYSNSVIDIINVIIVPVLMAIALLVFLWGVYKYFIQGAADEKSREDGRQFTLWGLIGFVVIVSVWGIVAIFMSTLGLTTTNAPPPPTFGSITTGTQTSEGNLLGNPAGTVGGTAGVMSQATAAALTTQNQQMTATCNSYGATSPQCQAAQTAYTQAYNSAQSGGGIGTQGSSCTTSANCVTGLICDTTTNPGFAYCAYATGGAGTVTQGGSCNTNSDCGSGLICDTTTNPGFSYCAYPTSGAGASTEGGSCNVNSDCASGLICDTTTNPGFSYCAYPSSSSGSSTGGASSNLSNGSYCGETGSAGCASGYCNGATELCDYPTTDNGTSGTSCDDGSTCSAGLCNDGTSC